MMDEEAGLDRERVDGSSSDEDDVADVSDSEPTEDVQSSLHSGGEVRLSKKAQARARRKQFLFELKEKKKRQRKELKDAQKAEAQGTEQEGDETSGDPVVNEAAQARRKQKSEAFVNLCAQNFEILIDCSWEHEHNERSLISLVQQVMFCHGFNKKQPNPVQMRVIGCGDKTIDRLHKFKYENWLGCHVQREELSTILSDYNTAKSSHDDSKKELVYLTSDAEETLETVSPNCTYIIGGIVDRNRLKGATFQKAQELGIRTAKLPIKEHLAMCTTHVLAVNHVFELLVRFQRINSWTEVLQQVLPQRKDAVLKPVVAEENATATATAATTATTTATAADDEEEES